MNSQLALRLARTHQADLRRGAAERRRARRPARPLASPLAALFAAMFAAQAGLLSLAPVLPNVAGDFGITAAAAGQLRTLGGLAGGVTAVAVALVGPRLGLRGTLIAGHLMLALGTLASAAAPSLAVLAAGQAGVGGAGPGNGLACSRRRRLASRCPGSPRCHSVGCSPSRTGAIRSSAPRSSHRS